MPAPSAPPADAPGGGNNDVTERERLWQRFAGDEWACFDALPPALRRRMHEHAYDAWAVNALRVWRAERRRIGSARAERRLLRWLDECEALERAAFAEAYARRYAASLPHEAAGATILRYRPGAGASWDGSAGKGRAPTRPAPGPPRRPDAPSGPGRAGRAR
jgi:hypothetical protein